MRLSELQTKRVVDVRLGSNVGNIIDVNISNDGRVESLIVDNGKRFFSLNRESDLVLLWNHIEKIGEDFILVRIE